MVLCRSVAGFASSTWIDLTNQTDLVEHNTFVVCKGVVQLCLLHAIINRIDTLGQGHWFRK